MLFEGRTETTAPRNNFCNKVILEYGWSRYGTEEHRPYSTNEYAFEFIFNSFPTISTTSYSNPKKLQNVTWG